MDLVAGAHTRRRKSVEDKQIRGHGERRYCFGYNTELVSSARCTRERAFPPALGDRERRQLEHPLGYRRGKPRRDRRRPPIRNARCLISLCSSCSVIDRV